MIVKLNFINDLTSPSASEMSDLTFIIEEPRPSFFMPACKTRDSSISICRGTVGSTYSVFILSMHLLDKLFSTRGLMFLITPKVQRR